MDADKTIEINVDEGTNIDENIILNENQQSIEENNQDENNIEETNTTEDNADFDVNEIYNYLRDYNIAPELQDDVSVTTMDDVAKIISEQQSKLVSQKIQEELQGQSQEYRDLFNYVKSGGNPEDFIKSYKTDYENFNTKDLNNNSMLQDKVLRDFYKQTTQWDDKTINMFVDKLNDDDKTDISKKAVPQLQQIQQVKKDQLFKQQEETKQQQEKYIQQQIDIYDKQLNELNKIGDYYINPKEKQNINNHLFNDITYNKLTKEFDKYRVNLSILDSYGILDDINNITKLMESKNKTSYKFKRSNVKTPTSDIGGLRLELE